eukprot:TRINITY_DN37764_c0_g1_i1.p1 TRINITY_DN37764_c0_g1~~TRINITY_DN37764_c0_g1_i1.p1  ORF type:complete len:293 (-),score=29.28 TRINITY_DN37764_c0_g1_i1:326-1204(-)
MDTRWCVTFDSVAEVYAIETEEWEDINMASVWGPTEEEWNERCAELQNEMLQIRCLSPELRELIALGRAAQFHAEAEEYLFEDRLPMRIRPPQWHLTRDRDGAFVYERYPPLDTQYGEDGVQDKHAKVDVNAYMKEIFGGIGIENLLGEQIYEQCDSLAKLSLEQGDANGDPFFTDMNSTANGVNQNFLDRPYGSMSSLRLPPVNQRPELWPVPSKPTCARPATKRPRPSTPAAYIRYRSDRPEAGDWQQDLRLGSRAAVHQRQQFQNNPQPFSPNSYMAHMGHMGFDMGFT